MGWLHDIIMIGGGLYWLWMGCHLLRSACNHHKQPPINLLAIELPNKGMSFLKGFLTNLSNLKAIIYFGSVFSFFVGNYVSVIER